MSVFCHNYEIDESSVKLAVYLELVDAILHRAHDGTVLVLLIQDLLVEQLDLRLEDLVLFAQLAAVLVVVLLQQLMTQ